MVEMLWEGVVEAEGKRPASDRKRRRARERGQVAWTPVPGVAVGSLWLLAVIAGGTGVIGSALATMATDFLDFGDGPLEPLLALDRCVSFLAPLVLACLVVPLAVAALGTLQAGAHWVGLRAGADDEGGGAFRSNLFSGLRPGGLVLALGGSLALGLTLVWTGQVALRPTLAVLSRSLEGGLALLSSRATAALGAATTVLVVLAAVDYVLRRRRFEVSIAMTPDEVRREAWEDQGRPEVVGERERLARQILEGGAPDVVLVASDGAAIVMGRRAGQGAPMVVARVPSPASLPYVATLRGRGVPVATEPVLARALEGVRPGQDVPSGLLDPLAALYRRLGVGASATTRGGRE